MPIYVNTVDPPPYIKVKGKVYKRLETPPINGVFVQDIDEVYSRELEAFFADKLYNEELKLRPVFTVSLPPNSLNLQPYTTNITNLYSVFVIPKNNTNPFFGQGSTFTVALCGLFQSLELNLLRGKRYIFKQNDSSNSGNRITLTSDAAGLNAVVFPTSQYIGTPGINGELSFIIPMTANDTYYLSTQTGQFMGIKINVDKYIESLPSHVAEFNTLSSSGYYTLLPVITGTVE